MNSAEQEEALELVSEIQKDRSGIRLGGFNNSQVPFILLPYQIRWHQDNAIVRLCEKGRRVGFTWGGWAAEAALEAALGTGGMDQFYMGYNQGMAAEFIGDCANFAKFFNTVCSQIDVGYQSVIIDDEKRDIVTYKIKFASGNKVEALSAMPHNWRGRQGHARIDEAGHHQRLEEVINGALAYRIWGGRVSIGGTHNGEDNPFNEFIKRCKAKKLNWSLHTIRFSDAIREGLFKRICLVTQKPWTPEAEEEFVRSVHADYPNADAANEELECIPRRGSGVYFSRLLLEHCTRPNVPILTFSKPAAFVTDPERLAITQQWIDQVLSPTISAMPKHLRSVFGSDFGRSGDLSVNWVLQKALVGLGWDTSFLVELRNIPFDCQVLIRDFLLDNLPLFHHAKFDARGNGQSHAEGAMQKYGPQKIECVMMTGAWYDKWFPKYHQAFEDREITIPVSEDVIADHRSVVLIKGCPRVSDARTRGSDGGDRHGDSAVAGVLAWAAANSEGVPSAGTSVEASPATYRSERGNGRSSLGIFHRERVEARNRPVSDASDQTGGDAPDQQ